MKLLDVDLPKVDIILHEIFGSDPFGEFVIPALSDAKRFLKPDGILLPESIHLTFRPKQFKVPEPLIYKDINLQEALDIFTTQYPHLKTSNHAEDDFLFVTDEIKLSELIENQNFKAQVTSEKFINTKILEVAFVIKHNEDSILSYEIGSKEPPKHWNSFYLCRKTPDTAEIIFSLEGRCKLVCL